MTDRRTVYTIVCFLGALALLLYGSAIYLLGRGIEVPDALWLAAGTASGSLGGLLVSTRSSPPGQEEEDLPT